MLRSKRNATQWLGAAAGVTALVCASAAMGDDPRFGEVKAFDGPWDLDLTGNFVYAVNVTPNGEEFKVRDVMFTSSNYTSGITVTSPRGADNWRERPNFGESEDHRALEDVMWDMRWSTDQVNVRADVNRGQVYKLQLLFSEAQYLNPPGKRTFDVFVNGELAIDEFDVQQVTGPQNGRVEVAAVYTWTFRAQDDLLAIDLHTGDTWDVNPVLNGLTLEAVPAPATIGLMGLGGLMISRRRRRSA